MQSTLLRPVYRRALKGIPLLGTPSDAVRSFAGGDGTLDARADRMITAYMGMGGAAGFAFGLPGILLTPITLPANVASVALIQMHMTAAVAVLGGHDLAHIKTRERCIECLLEKITDEGTNTEKKEAAARTGVKVFERGAQVAFGLTLGGKAARGALVRGTVLRRVPLIGGVIGASSDAYVTAFVGRCAKRTFLADVDVAPGRGAIEAVPGDEG